MNISICILNWKAASITIRCLNNILKLEGIANPIHQIDIVIVDNNSPDNSSNRIKEFIENSEYRRFHFIQSSDNKGYASGNNLAISYSLEYLSPQYIWILNNDTLPHEKSLAALLKSTAEDPSVAIWGSTLLDENGEFIECAGGSYYNPCTSTYKNALKGLPLHEISNRSLKKPLDYIEGAAMFVDANIFREHGLFNEDFFLYFEELDLAKRLPPDRHTDWCSNSLVIHVGGASVASDVAEYQSNISALIYTRKYHPYCFPFMVVFRFCAKAIRHTLSGRWGLNKTLLLSYKQYFHTQAEHSR